MNTEQRIHPGLPSSICLLCWLAGQGQPSSRSLPGEQDGTSLQRAARPNHTLRKTLQPFGTRCRRAAAMQLPIRFGRIAYKSNPTQSVSLSQFHSARCHPIQSVRDSHVSNQLLRNAAPLSPHSLSLSTPRRFPWPDVHSGSGTQFMLHRLRTTASCLWPYVAPHSTLFRGAVTRLSYPETPSFLRCQLLQVSPHSPRALLHAHQPSCAALVALLRYAPRVRLHSLSLNNRSLGHFLPSAVSASPVASNRSASANCAGPLPEYPHSKPVGEWFRSLSDGASGSGRNNAPGA